MKRNGTITQDMAEVLKRSGDSRREVREPAEAELCRILASAVSARSEKRNKQILAALEGNERVLSLETPIRKGIMSGDLISPLFEELEFEPGVNPEIPIDPLVPGTEHYYNAFAIPQHGRTPTRMFEADALRLPTYAIGTALGWTERQAQTAQWNIVQRMMEVAEAGMVKKKNDDGFHVIIGAGAARNAVIYDASAAQGQFTTRLVSLMKTYVRRNGGGNTSSVDNFTLTHLYGSPETIESMRTWGLDIVDDLTRREIYVMQDGSVSRVFGVNIIDIVELGAGQEYQLYFEDDLGGQLAQAGGAHGHNDVELLIGLDLTRNRSLVMPTVGGIDMREDPTAPYEYRRRYRWKQELGFACVDNRVVILGSY